MIFLLFILHQIEKIQNFNSVDVLVAEILFFKLILICKFKNVPCELGFEVKHSKFFCRSFRACIPVLSMDFTIINYFHHNIFKMPKRTLIVIL